MRLSGDFYNIELAGTDAALAHLNAEHPIYRAHFPGQPIAPGVCIIQMAVEICGELEGRRFEVLGIRDAKFLAPVIPGSCKALRFEYEPLAWDGDNVRIQAGVSDADSGAKVAKIIILCRASS